MPKINEIERRVRKAMTAMTGEDQIRLLLKDAGYETLREFAAEIGTFSPEISMCLKRVREYPGIRNALAEKLNLTREQVDEMLPWPPEALAEVA